jgi:RNA polymerase sigma-70 factor, ECF subfamily
MSPHATRGAEEADRDADEAMARYSGGDDAAFGAVYDAVAPRLERYLRRHLREGALVDDVIQQTFLQMHAKRGTFRRGAQVVPWAFCIARNFMIDAIRRARREQTTDDGSADVSGGWLVAAFADGEEMVAAREAKQRIDALFAGLSPHQRAAFELTKGDGLSHAAAAQILGTTVMGVKQCVHKVYKKLEQALGLRGEPEPAETGDAAPASPAVNRS